ncbi:MAG: hypothetical protein K2Y32_07690 [Candidatus Obscuribacterales bacterium]|nr:hypothetical protein [Candidatus Obscuribacterales bacterium]
MNSTVLRHLALTIKLALCIFISFWQINTPAQGQTKGSAKPEKVVERKPLDKPEKTGKTAKETSLRYPLIIITHKKTNLLLEEIQKEKRREKPRQQVIFYYSQRILMFNHRIEEAKKTIAAKLITNPNWPLLYLLQAEIAELEFREEDQVRYLKKALEADPACVSAVDSLSQYYSESGHTQEALALLKSTLNNISPERSAGRIETLKNLAKVQLYLKDAAGAEASLKEVLKMSPDDELAVLRLIRIYEMQGRWKEVYALANEHLKPSKADDLFILYRAKASFNLGDLKKAELDVNSFLNRIMEKGDPAFDVSLNFDYEDATKLRAKIYEQTGRQGLAKAEREHLKSSQKQTYKRVMFRQKEEK